MRARIREESNRSYRVSPIRLSVAAVKAKVSEQKSPTGMLFLSNELLPDGLENVERLQIECV